MNTKQFRVALPVTIMTAMFSVDATAQFAWDGDCGINWYDCCNYGTEQNPVWHNNWTIAPNTSTCPDFPGSNDDVFASSTVLLQQPYQTWVNSLSVTGTFILRSELRINDHLTISGTITEPTTVLMQNGPANGTISFQNPTATATISSFCTFDFQIDGSIWGPATGLLTNNGLIWKSNGGDDPPPYESLSALNIPWENHGTIKATDGRLVLMQDGVNDGIIEALGDAEIRFQGNAVIDGEVRGDGLVRFVYSQTTVTGDYHPTNTLIAGGGANVNFDVDTSVENLTLGNSGVISGTGDLTIDDLIWNGGYSTMAPGGSTIVQDSMLIQHDAFAGGNFAINREMELHGASEIQGAAQVHIDEGELRNYGELQLLGASSLLQPCCVPDSIIRNFGMLRKVSGDQSVINVKFFNFGDIVVESSSLNFDGEISNQHAIAVNAGATLYLGHQLQSNHANGSITGDGGVFFFNDFWSGDTTVDSILGTYDVGATTIQAGTVSFDTDGTIAPTKTTSTLNLIQGFGQTKLQGNADLVVGNQLNWSAGEMTGTGTTVVIGPLVLTGSASLARVLELNANATPGPTPPAWTMYIQPLGTLHCRDVTIDGHLNNDGLVSPGTPTAPVGHLHLTGGYTQTAGGVLALHRLGPAHDHLLVDGVATLGGTLNATGYPAGGGQVFTLLSAASVQGNFSQVNIPNGAQVIYTSTSVKLQMPGTPCPGDVNGDGSVNVADLLAVITSWGPCGVCGDCAADIAPAKPDCMVNVADLLTVISHWGACP